MDSFYYRNGQLFCEDVNVDLLAKKVQTPFYLYSESTLKKHFFAFRDAFEALNPRICFSIKNCANINIIKILGQCGAGIDVVSGGEVFRAIEAGILPSKIVFAGVGKTESELRYAIESGVGWINVESEEEFELASQIASKLKKEANVALRVNPNIFDEKTHDKCTTGNIDSKFGVDISRASNFFKTYGNDPFLKLSGIHIHLGSPVFSGRAYVEAIEVILELIEDIHSAGGNINMLDIGGGYVAHYDDQEEANSWNEYANEIIPALKPFVNVGGIVVMEPGRSITANAGVCISRVQYQKQGVSKKFVILDVGMAQLLRPALYDAYHFIWPTVVKPEQIPQSRAAEQGVPGLESFDIVGPICESSDYLAKDRKIPPVKRGDLICVFTAGAYGMSMASQYNGSPRPAEILVNGKEIKVIRKRETYADLIQLELETEVVTLDKTTFS